MGWSSDLFCNITYNKKTYNSKCELLDDIEDLKRYIQICKDNLRNLVVMTEPQKFCPNENDPLIWIENELRDNLESIEEDTVELYKLELLLDNWDACHNEDGLAIDPPDNIHWDSAFFRGDFVKSIKYPNE